MKAVLYLRVSTGEQTVEPQRLELMDVCARRGWTVVAAVEEHASGAKVQRSGLDQVLGMVRKRAVQVVVCAKLDRLGRSLPHLAQVITEFDTAGVALVCPGQGIDTSNANPAGRLQMHVLMAVAEFERTLISERTRAGLRSARARGAKIGRPRVRLPEDWGHRLEIWRVHNSGKNYAVLARMLGVSKGTAYAIANKEAA
jgi:DNA invertase Pin-like site-specific DNA recombinase